MLAPAERRDQIQERNQGGFSLLEVMVSMAVMLIVLAAVFALMKDSIRSGTSTFELTDAQQNLRTAHEYFNRDLIIAGDGFRGVNSPRVNQTFVQNYLTRTPVTPVNGYVNLALVNSDNQVPTSTNVPASTTFAATTVRPNTDRIVILAVDRDTRFPVAAARNGSNADQLSIASADASKFEPGEIFFITADGRSAFVQIKAKTTSGATTVLDCGAGGAGITELGINTTPSGQSSSINYVSNNGVSSLSISRVQIVTYFINEQNLLVRRVFGIRGTNIATANGKAFADSVIAEQVADLQLSYRVQQTDSGGHLIQPKEALTTATDQTALRQVQVNVTVQTMRPIVQRRDPQTGDIVNLPEQISAVTTIGLRNLQFLRNKY